MHTFTLYIGNKNYSSWSLRAYLALETLVQAYPNQINYQEQQLELDTDAFYEVLKPVNASCTVPTLVHHTDAGDVTVWDSLAIIDYLDKLFPDYGLWPMDLRAFGQAKAISAEMHSGFMGLRGHLHMNMRQVFKGRGFGPLVQKNIDRIHSLWTETLDQFSGDGPYLFGETFTAADMIYAPVVSRFRTYDIQSSDQVTAYRQAVENHPAYTRWYEAALQETSVVAADEIDQSLKVLG